MFQVFVDSAANLPAVTAKKYDIHVVSFVNLVNGKKKQYFRCLQQFRKKYSETAVVSLVAPFTEDCGLFRDRTKRSYPVRHGFRCSNRKKY